MVEELVGKEEGDQEGEGSGAGAEEGWALLESIGS